MPAPSFREALTTAWEDIQATVGNGKPINAAQWLRMVAEVAQTLASLCNGLGQDDAAFEQLCQDAEWFAREYIVKPDLPFLNDFVENYFVDPQIVPMMRPLLLSLRPAPSPQ